VTLDNDCGVPTPGGGVSVDDACGKQVQTGFPQVTEDKDCGVGTSGGLSKDDACGKLFSPNGPEYWHDLTCGRPGGASEDKDCGLPSGPITYNIDNDCFLTFSDQDCHVTGVDQGKR
jgi:hypothetical protein